MTKTDILYNEIIRAIQALDDTGIESLTESLNYTELISGEDL